MSVIETSCPGCQQKLRVPSALAGQQARCPVCQEICTVPEMAAATAPSEPSDQWRLRTPEGQVYGPVPRTTLDTWVAEGRVSDDCQLCCAADQVWRGAEETYAVLRPVSVGVPLLPWSNPLDADLPDSDPLMTNRFRGQVVNAHRGGIILALGIFGWASGCPLFGIVAWTMGSSDLAEMRQGTMDPRGHDLTAAGRWIGMLQSLIAVGVLIVGLTAVLILRLF